MKTIGPAFVLYDGRASVLGTDRASVLDTAETEGEARKVGKRDWNGHDAVWVQYVNPQPGTSKGSVSYDERFRHDIPPGKRQ